MPRCAACSAKVDDGAVRCLSCDANLASTASFVQVLGWVLVAISSMPLGVGIVSEEENNHTPLLIGVGVLVLGGALIVVAWAQAKAARPLVLPDESVEGAA